MKIPYLMTADILLALGLATLFTGMTVSASIWQGKLSVPITYDDISYFADAAQRMQVFFNQGFLGLLQSFTSEPPHAPLSTIVALGSFAILGLHPWAVYLVNGIWVFSLLIGVRVLLHGQSLLTYAVVALTVLAWPLTSYLVMEGRPDIVTGLMMAAGCLFILSDIWVGASRRRIFVAALFAGLTLWTKPTIVPIALCLFAAACLLASAVDWSARRSNAFSFLSFLKTNITFVSIAMLIALPHFFFAWKKIASYIFENFFGYKSNIWLTEMPPLQSALYYSWGIGGERTMGPWLDITLALLVLVSILQYPWFMKNCVRVAAILSWFLVVYIIVTIPSVKTPYLGVVVSWALFLFFIFSLNLLFQTLSKLDLRLFAGRFIILRISVLSIGVIVALFLFHWHVYYYTGGLAAEPGNGALYARRFELLSSVADQIEREAQIPELTYLPTATQYFNRSALQFTFSQRHFADNLLVAERSTEADIKKHFAALASANAALIFDPTDPELIPYLPGTELLGVIATRLARDKDFMFKARFLTADGQHYIDLYHRRPVLEGVRVVSGFLPFEGPYPKQQLPIFRWATGSDAKLVVIAEKPHALHLEGRSTLADQFIGVGVNDHYLGECHFPEDGTTGECNFDIPREINATELTLHFSHPGTDEEGQRSAIFQRISVN